MAKRRTCPCGLPAKYEECCGPLHRGRVQAETADHLEGRVEFRAHYTRDGAPSHLHENSHFTRHQGAWVYVDAG